MNDKQKAALADRLTLYIKAKHTVDECSGFADGFNAAFDEMRRMPVDEVKDVDNNQFIKANTQPKDDRNIQLVSGKSNIFNSDVCAVCSYVRQSTDGSTSSYCGASNMASHNIQDIFTHTCSTFKRK